MAIETVAILSPGAMGGAVGRVLKESGLDVTTCLMGRSERTTKMAQVCGFRAVPDLETLVRESDLVLSILAPGKATAVAAEISNAMKTANARPPFADCNAVSPKTAQSMAQSVAAVGGDFIDASIMGDPPSGETSPTFYVSGQDASLLSELDGRGIDVIAVGNIIGNASAIKMCHSALSKGSIALRTSLLIAASRLGVYEEVCVELERSQRDHYEHMQNSVPGLATKSYRWVAEMEEVASMFEAIGLSPSLGQGAADLFRLVAASRLADADQTGGQALNIAVSMIAEDIDKQKFAF